jgi:1-acyl-sn-glycerol-3-phosphate acyltransferase
MLRGWARSALWFFYRDVEVTGARRIAADRPTVFAANHSNALGDVAILVAKLPRFPRFLATATWWDRAPARLLFWLGGVLPVDRARDGDANHNSSTFAACRSALGQGEHIAIFPEGELNEGPSLLPLRTGAARIALSAADAGIRDVVIEPVGLVYEDRGRFRSRVEMKVAEPIEIEDWLEAYRDDPFGTVHDVTDLLAARLAAATVTSHRDEVATLARRAVTIVLADPIREPGDPIWAAHPNELSRRLVAALADAEGHDGGAAVRELADAVTTHSTDLARLGLAEAHPLEIAPESTRSRRRAELLILSPAAAVGAIATAPIVLTVSLAGRLVRGEGWRATVVAVGGTLLLPLNSALELMVGSRRIGLRRAAALTAAGVVSSTATIWWFDRLQEARADRRSSHALGAGSEAVAQARQSRAEVARQVWRLVGRHPSCPPRT